MFGNIDLDKLSEFVEISAEDLDYLLKNPFDSNLSAKAAINLSEKLKIPLHPRYTYHWNVLSADDLLGVVDWLDKGKVEEFNGRVNKIILPLEKEHKRKIEMIGLPHIVATEFVVINKYDAESLLATLNISNKTKIDDIKQKILENKDKKTVDIINIISKIKVRDKSGTFIGARMGRPEKAKMRKLIGAPQVLFPVGEEGGRMRSFQSALEAGKITAELPLYKCECGKETVFSVCDKCGKRTKKIYFCNICGRQQQEECKMHGKNKTFSKQSINIVELFNNVITKLNMKTYPDLIKGVKGTSNKDHIPEHLAKGILRAKYDITVNKDGTTRYDMSEIPITHFKPKEIGTSIEKLKELGYEKDINGRNLESEEQIVELKPQDIILPSSKESLDEGAADILFKISKFIDELLVSFYNLEPFYNLNKPQDLVGHLVIGLAPHISAGMIGRIIGFSETQGLYAHPLFHAALRRDCDGDEACVILLMDALLNFSRQYLPDKRGGRTMDAPLVLTSTINPAEVDDMVHKLDVSWRYPLEFYESCLEYKDPSELKISVLKDYLGTEKQYEGYGFTHDVSNINIGVRCSAYKILPSMEDKLKGQMELAEKIRAVDQSDVARLVIEKHFLKDTKGNLRKFSMQKFRCSKCNEIYRRPPLVGKCTKCGGRIIFTISEGSIVKYLEPSISLAKKYDVPSYLKQSLELLKRRIEGVFGKEKEKQVGLGAWFG